MNWWRDAIAICASNFGIKPPDFWKMTLKELDAVLSSFSQLRTKTLDRSALVELMNAHPDKVQYEGTKLGQ